MPQLRAAPLEANWASVLAGAALLLVLAVIAASAYVRLGNAQVPAASESTIEAARSIRRGAGSLAAVGVAALALGAGIVRTNRGILGPAAAGALALTIALAVVGFATGIQPPRWAAYANQLGGVLLAGVLAWLSGRAGRHLSANAGDRRLAAAALVLCMLQVAFGGAIATSTRDPSAALLILHAVVGVAAACCAAALAVCLSGKNASALSLALAACVIAVPLIGLALTLASMSVAAQVAHAISGAVLLACVAFAAGRLEPGA